MPIDKLLEWIAVLDQPQAATGGLPTCPYALRALKQGKVEIIFRSALEIELCIRDIIDQWSGLFDIKLVVCDPNAISPDTADQLGESLDKRAQDKDLIVMVDHPDRPFVVAGHNNSNGEFVIFFIQRRSKLQTAGRTLEAAGYYRNWP